MTDYISREALLERIDGIWDCADMVFEPTDHCCRADDCASCKWRETKNAIRKIAANIPAADVRPVVMGTWRQIGPKEAVCSVCNNVTLTNGIDRTGHANIHKALYHFCPNCGADMREEPPKEET